MAALTTTNLEAMIYNRAQTVYAMILNTRSHFPPLEDVKFGPIDYSQVQIKTRPASDSSLRAAANTGKPIAQTCNTLRHRNNTTAENTKTIKTRLTTSTVNVTFTRGAYFGTSGFGLPLPLGGDEKTHFGNDVKLTGLNGQVEVTTHEIQVENTIIIPSKTEVTATIVEEIKNYETDFKLTYLIKGRVRVPVYRSSVANFFITSLDDLYLEDIVEEESEAEASLQVQDGHVVIETEGKIKFRYSVDSRMETAQEKI